MGVGRFNAGVKFCDEVASHPVGGGGGRQGLEVEQKYSYSIHICYRSGKKSGFEIGGGVGGGGESGNTPFLSFHATETGYERQPD